MQAYNLFALSAYHLYGKPGNSGENSNRTVHPVGILRKRSNTFRGITVFPFLPKRPKVSEPFVWITSARLHVERKRKIYRYFVNGTTQSRSCFRCEKKYQYHLTEIFHRNFRTNGKHSLHSVLCLPKCFLQVTFVVLVLIPCNLVMRPVTYEAAARVSFNKPDFE